MKATRGLVAGGDKPRRYAIEKAALGTASGRTTSQAITDFFNTPKQVVHPNAGARYHKTAASHCFSLKVKVIPGSPAIMAVRLPGARPDIAQESDSDDDFVMILNLLNSHDLRMWLA